MERYRNAPSPPAQHSRSRGFLSNPSTLGDAADRLSAALADRYVIERDVGRGGMATVYLARDIRHERQVAIKVLDPELGAVLGADRFLGEIRVTAKLQHPNILPLFDSGQAAGLLFYAMPFVEGITRGKQESSFVRMIMELARTLGLEVIAEGIESPDQLAALRELGCEMGQGFHLGLPAGADNPATAGVEAHYQGPLAEALPRLAGRHGAHRAAPGPHSQCLYPRELTRTRPAAM